MPDLRALGLGVCVLCMVCQFARIFVDYGVVSFVSNLISQLGFVHVLILYGAHACHLILNMIQIKYIHACIYKR